jgi:hypothetical protein
VHEIDPLTVDDRGELRDLVEFTHPSRRRKRWRPTSLVEVTMQPNNLCLIDFNPERQYVAVVIGHSGDVRHRLGPFLS